MKLELIKSRNYLLSEDQKKMIPAKYLNIINELELSNFDFSNRFLSSSERFLLEVELLKETIKLNEPYVFELIKGKKVTEASFVKCKFTENRCELKFEKFNVKTPILLYQLAPDNIKNKRFSDY